MSVAEMERQQGRPHGQKTKIDWSEAERFFMYDESRPSVAEVARRFGVSRLVAYRNALRWNWRKRRDEAEKQIHLLAKAELDKDALDRAVVRLRRVVRLVDSALDEAAIDPSPEAVRRVLCLINVEREIVDGLPQRFSRERVLREHVERACRLAGTNGDDDGR